MPVTVGFDATAAIRQSAGIGRYTRQLLAAMSDLTDGPSFRMFACAGGNLRGHLPELDRARFSTRLLPVSDRVINAMWHRARIPLPVQLVVGNFDVFHSPDFTLPPVWGRPTVVTVHDLAFLRMPECAFPSLRDYLMRVVPRSVRSASHVIAVSESTRQDVINLLGVSPRKVTTVLEAVGSEFVGRPQNQTGTALQTLGINGPFILSVGTLEPRKNYVRLLEAYALLRGKGLDRLLVIAGAPGWLYQPIFDAIHRLQLSRHVLIVQPTDDQLVALYSATELFVYASLYEGFGIPPLEALACGAPVACSNAASLPEVVGSTAVTFNPTQTQEIVAAMERILFDRWLRDELRRAGPLRARDFTWRRAAEQTVKVYQDVMHG